MMSRDSIGYGVYNREVTGMKWTKRSRKQNIKRVLLWYVRECKINDLDVGVGMPELWKIIEDEGELDFDDVVRAFDFIGVDLIAIPRGESRKMEWFTLTEMPYDDGGKKREVRAIELKRTRTGKVKGRGKGRVSEGQKKRGRKKEVKQV